MLRRLPFPALAAALVLCVVAQAARAFCFNLDKSFPVGLYRFDPAPTPSRGSLVLVCRRTLKPRVVGPHHSLGRAHCPSFTEPLLKMVVGTGGDSVEVTSDSVKVNGVRLPHSAPRIRDRRGAPLPQLPRGDRRLHRRELWIYGPVANSWDSRYFGPVTREEVRAVARPVLVWKR